MGEHRFDLPGFETVQQRVEEHDALVAPETGEIGVTVPRSPGAVHHADALARITSYNVCYTKLLRCRAICR